MCNGNKLTLSNIQFSPIQAVWIRRFGLSWLLRNLLPISVVSKVNAINYFVPLCYFSLNQIYLLLRRLILMSCVINKYWLSTYECDEGHGLAIRIYLSGIIVIICVNLILSALIVNRSANGGITDTSKRWLVAPLLTVKILLILPETILNIFATIWAFCSSITCNNQDFYTKVVIESKLMQLLYFIADLLIPQSNNDFNTLLHSSYCRS